MAKYLLLKHYRGGPAPAVDGAPMDQWTPDEVDAHVQFMREFAARLEETGEFVDTQALAPDGAFVRYDGEGRPPVTDGPFVETKDLIAGGYIIDVESWDRTVQLAGNCRRPPGPAASRSTNGWRFGRFWPTRPRSPSERAAAKGPRTHGDRCPGPARGRLRVGRGRRAGGLCRGSSASAPLARPHLSRDRTATAAVNRCARRAPTTAVAV